MKPSSMKSLKFCTVLYYARVSSFIWIPSGLPQNAANIRDLQELKPVCIFRLMGANWSSPSQLRKFSRLHHPVSGCIKYIHMTVKAEWVMFCVKSHLELLPTTILCWPAWLRATEINNPLLLARVWDLRLMCILSRKEIRAGKLSTQHYLLQALSIPLYLFRNQKGFSFF